MNQNEGRAPRHRRRERRGEHDGKELGVHRRELANLAAFLASDGAAYINGECVVIDGGEWIGSGGEFNGLIRMPRAMVKGALKAMRGK